jgi:hypothetical protein
LKRVTLLRSKGLDAAMAKGSFLHRCLRWRAFG